MFLSSSWDSPCLTTECMHRTKSFTCPTFTRRFKAQSGFFEPRRSCATSFFRKRERSSRPMIIDCHCHAGKGDIMTAPWNTDAPLAAYLRRARAAGIDRTVIFAPFTSDYHTANREVARIVARHPSRLIGFAFVHAVRDAGRIHNMVK